MISLPDTNFKLIFFPQVTFYKVTAQFDMLLHHNLDGIDIKTQKVGCRNSKPKGCDVGAVT